MSLQALRKCVLVKLFKLFTVNYSFLKQNQFK